MAARRCFLAAMLAVCVAGCASTGVTRPVVFASATPGAPQKITGTLVRPAGNGPFPAVVQLHGCHGVEEQSYRWARWFADRGYVTLVVDSFTPRNANKDCRTSPDEPPVTARFDDAIGALRYLQTQRFVIPDRVAAIGWSQGGVYAMSVVNGPSLVRAARRGADIPTIGFAAGIAVYPGGCESLVNEQMVRPLLVLIGGADDWTPAEHCDAMVRAMQSRGADVNIVVYPGAYHYFDKEGQPKTFLATVENDTKPTGLGATVEYQPEAATDAQHQIASFLARYLRLRVRPAP